MTLLNNCNIWHTLRTHTDIKNKLFLYIWRTKIFGNFVSKIYYVVRAYSSFIDYKKSILRVIVRKVNSEYICVRIFTEIRSRKDFEKYFAVYEPEIEEYEYGNGQCGQRHGVAPFVDQIHLVSQLKHKKRRQK